MLLEKVAPGLEIDVFATHDVMAPVDPNQPDEIIIDDEIEDGEAWREQQAAKLGLPASAITRRVERSIREAQALRADEAAKVDEVPTAKVSKAKSKPKAEKNTSVFPVYVRKDPAEHITITPRTYETDGSHFGEVLVSSPRHGDHVFPARLTGSKKGLDSAPASKCADKAFEYALLYGEQIANLHRFGGNTATVIGAPVAVPVPIEVKAPAAPKPITVAATPKPAPVAPVPTVSSELDPMNWAQTYVSELIERCPAKARKLEKSLEWQLSQLGTVPAELWQQRAKMAFDAKLRVA